MLYHSDLPKLEAAPDCCKEDSISMVWLGYRVFSIVVQREGPLFLYGKAMILSSLGKKEDVI